MTVYNKLYTPYPIILLQHCIYIYVQKNVISVADSIKFCAYTKQFDGHLKPSSTYVLSIGILALISKLFNI